MGTQVSQETCALRRDGPLDAVRNTGRYTERAKGLPGALGGRQHGALEGQEQDWSEVQSEKDEVCAAQSPKEHLSPGITCFCDSLKLSQK